MLYLVHGVSGQSRSVTGAYRGEAGVVPQKPCVEDWRSEACAGCVADRRLEHAAGQTQCRARAIGGDVPAERLSSGSRRRPAPVAAKSPNRASAGAQTLHGSEVVARVQGARQPDIPMIVDVLDEVARVLDT